MEHGGKLRREGDGENALMHSQSRATELGRFEQFSKINSVSLPERHSRPKLGARGADL
jgi:hypothetical protein